jgi:hypothetical protein
MYFFVHVLTVAISILANVAHHAGPLIAGLCSHPQIALLALAIPNVTQLKKLANRMHSRMQSLGLNETQLSERCSLAAIHLFEGTEVPGLTRDRIAKILMNRQERPAKSAARIISQSELKVLASVLKVSPEWLIGQEENRDPVVWNVLAQADRVHTFTHLMQEYEEVGKQTTVWSRSPAYPFVSEDFIRCFNQIYFGKKDLAGNRSLVEFFNTVARARRKWVLRPERSFDYVNILFKSDFEEIVGGQGPYSCISKTILTRNLQVMIDAITDPSFRMKLILIRDEKPSVNERLQGYNLLGTVDDLLSIWNYHNGDIGWSEHFGYVKSHNDLLEHLMRQPHLELDETVKLIESLRSTIRSRS